MANANYYVPDNRPWFNLYDESIEHHIDYLEEPLYYFLDKAAKEYPKNIALSFYGTEINYKDYKELVDKFAHALQLNGIHKGDRVIIMAVNCPQAIISIYGTMKAGAIPIPLNPLYTAKELEYFFKDLEPRIVITPDNFYNNVFEAAKVTPQIEKIISTNISDYFPTIKKYLARILGKIKVIKCNEAIDFKEFINVSSEYEQININPKEDTALMVYTGGTTGEPKGVMLTHYNVMANILNFEEWFKNVSIKSCLLVVPLFHIYGSGPIINFIASRCGKMVILPKFNTKETIKELLKHKVNGLFCVPAIYAAFIKYYQDNPNEPKLTDVTFCASGSTSISSYVWKNLQKIIPNAFLIEGYGLSETCPGVIMDPVDNKYEKRINSVGVPMTDVDAKIIDLITGEELPPEKSGEIIIKGPSIFKGYWKKEEKTKKALKDGWFYTNDIGRMDKDGIFYIEGRRDDMINVRGEKVWPREIETVLEQNPKILDVAVIGVQNDYYGQAIKACIVLKQGFESSEKEIIDYCKEKIAPHKIPQMVEFFKELPKSNLGKTLHSQLRKREIK
ncbi:MAG: AMP-binding protein [Candidatus Pacebacteria bacterium]|nr:AMP-binding protein [Candidatus Paceibacterota bacterium]MDD5013338.1 AMP-binding protein [Candidatus Paceibacterota bacterium]MDD5752626.1 AMP-binding protein [Candidatus Paceibacterota bacterium]